VELVERVVAQVDGMPHDNCLMTQGLHHTFILSLARASSHHLPQDSSYHHITIKHMSDMYEYTNA
jgi:hypothetical protein